jgi:hypothetical protein
MRGHVSWVALVLAACERSHPPPPPAPEVAPSPRHASFDAAIDDARPDASTLVVKPGELVFLVALRDALATHGGTSVHPDPEILSVDLSDTARAEPRSIAIAAIDVTAREQLERSAEEATLDRAVKSLASLPAVHTKRDLKLVSAALDTTDDDAGAARTQRSCETEGCPETLCIDQTDRSARALAETTEQLITTWDVPGAASPELAAKIGRAFLDACWINHESLTPRAFLEKLAKLARASR